jgi:glycosyltransferase involved in cell wall biosynthesis
MEHPPAISVIIPARDHGRYIGEALESVLVQSLPAAEIIVIDDGSQDDTAGVVSRFAARVRYHYTGKKGAGAARNLGVRLSSGEMIAHLDADDVWAPGKLERQAREFSAAPDLDIAGGMMQPFFSRETNPDLKRKIACSPVPLPGFSASVLLVRRSSFFKVGFYREDMRLGQDLEWFLRAREVPLKEKMVGELVAYRRLHDRNCSQPSPNDRAERLRVLKESLDRRRTPGPAADHEK